MQDVSMQLDRLEKILDGLHNKTESNLGASDPITIQVLQAMLYLQGLKYDLNNSSEVIYDE